MFTKAVQLFPWPITNKLQLHWIRGILAFICYRDGHGDDLFDEGSALLTEMEKRLERAKYLFQNKVHLMKAEYFASTCACEVKKAKEEYIASIKSAKVVSMSKRWRTNLWGII